MAFQVTVKRQLIIFHKPEEWEKIYAGILKEFGPRIAISWVMQQELGFSIRSHRGLVPNLVRLQGGPSMHYELQTHLDFFTESAQSWFQLRYL